MNAGLDHFLGSPSGWWCRQRRGEDLEVVARLLSAGSRHALWVVSRDSDMPPVIWL